MSAATGDQRHWGWRRGLEDVPSLQEVVRPEGRGGVRVSSCGLTTKRAPGAIMRRCRWGTTTVSTAIQHVHCSLGNAYASPDSLRSHNSKIVLLYTNIFIIVKKLTVIAADKRVGQSDLCHLRPVVNH
jgi:hypothetical protein